MSFGRPEHQCSFCSRPERDVERLIQGPDGIYICNYCVNLCYNLLEEEAAEAEQEDSPVFQLDNLMSPREIMAKLDEYVVGQDYAKRVLSVAVYNHYKRIQVNITSDVEIDKSNILVLGPTGSGKTLLAQTLARILDVPFCITDATTLTEAGYVGEDVENILLRLIQAADGDIARAERGIIYIDEIDKISRKSVDNPSITRDVSGEGVQQALLKIVEGTIANVPPQGGRKHPHQEFLQIDTRNILFICGGMFDGIENVISRRLGEKSSLGFQATTEGRTKKDKTELLKRVSPEDLIVQGMIPELVGRLPIVVSVEPLDKAALMRILVEPKNALTKQYKHMLGIDSVELEFDESALSEASDIALKRGTGARGLRSIIEKTLLDVMFEVPGHELIRKVVVDGLVIRGERAARIYDSGGKELDWAELDQKPVKPAA